MAAPIHSPRAAMSTLRAAVAGAVFLLAALLLQGCGGGSENLPLEVCPSFHFRHGHGFVHKAQAGEEPRISVPQTWCMLGRGCNVAG